MSDIYFATNRNWLAVDSEGQRSFALGEALCTGSEHSSLTIDYARLEGGQKAVFGNGFSFDGPEDLTFGYIKPENDTEKIPPTQLFGDPSTLSDYFESIRTEIKKENKDIVIYIHGFRTSFSGSVAGARQLSSALIDNDFPHVMCVFSWPSDHHWDTMKNYKRDRMDAMLSGPAIARSFQFMENFIADLSHKEFCNCKIHVICHSMGTYAFRYAFQKLKRDYKALPRLFNEIIFLAPDEDTDVFEKPEKCRELTHYVGA